MKKLLQLTLLMLFITGSMNYIQAGEEAMQSSRPEVPPQHQLTADQVKKANEQAIKQVAHHINNPNADTPQYQARINELQNSDKNNLELEKNQQSLSISKNIALGMSSEAAAANALQEAQAAHNAKPGSFSFGDDSSSPRSVANIDDAQPTAVAPKTLSVKDRAALLSGKSKPQPNTRGLLPSRTDQLAIDKAKSAQTAAKQPLFNDTGSDINSDIANKTDKYLNEGILDDQGNPLPQSQSAERLKNVIDQEQQDITSATKNSNPTISKSSERQPTEDILSKAPTNDVLSAKEQEESDKLQANPEVEDAAQNLASHPEDAATKEVLATALVNARTDLTQSQANQAKNAADALIKKTDTTTPGWWQRLSDFFAQAIKDIKNGNGWARTVAGYNKVKGAYQSYILSNGDKYLGKEQSSRATDNQSTDLPVYGAKTEADALADKGMTDDEITADSQARNEPIREEDVQAALQQDINNVNAGKAGAEKELAQNTVKIIGQKEYGKTETPEQQAARDQLAKETTNEIINANKTNKKWYEKIYHNLLVKMRYRTNEPVEVVKTLGDKTGLTDDELNQRQSFAQILNPKAIDTTAQPVSAAIQRKQNSQLTSLKKLFNSKSSTD